MSVTPFLLCDRGLAAADGSRIFGGGYKSGAVNIMKELHRKCGVKSET